MRADAESSCIALCTDSWRHWLGSLCAQVAPRTSRSSCCATNSQFCAGRTTGQRSPTRTGPCWVRSRRPCHDGGELAGSSHPRPCCVGIDAESPATGPNPAGRPGGPAPPWNCVASSSRWPPTTRHGATAASPANSSASVTALGPPLCGESSNSTASTPLRSARALTWTQFLRSQAAIACDFVTIDTALSRRYYLLFFIDITNREVLYGGITANPTAAWTTQSARNLLLRHPQQLTHTRALVRDRASQFTGDFDEIFRTEGLKILRTPVRVPVANAFAERWVGTLRRELLDRTIIWNQRQLQRLVIDYIDHYNTHRPHRSLDQRPPRHTTPDDYSTEHPLPLRLVPNDPLRWPHQRIQTCRLTSPDRVSGTHTLSVGSKGVGGSAPGMGTVLRTPDCVHTSTVWPPAL